VRGRTTDCNNVRCTFALGAMKRTSVSHCRYVLCTYRPLKMHRRCWENVERPNQTVISQLSGPLPVLLQFLDVMATRTLTRDDICDIVAQMRQGFTLTSRDWPNLEKLLIEIIKKSAVADLGYEPVREVLEQIEQTFDKDTWKDTHERVFRSCFVLIMMKRCPSLLLADVEELLEEFPGFAEADEAELELLVKFRNLMYCGIQLFTAKSNKGKLMDLAGRLSGKVYTTGGGSTIEAKRREAIYQELGGVVKKRLTVPRKRKLHKDELERSQGKGHRERQTKARRAPRNMASVQAYRPNYVSSVSMSPVKSSLDGLSIQDPDLLLLEPLAPDTTAPLLSSTWFETFEPSYKAARFSPQGSPMTSGAASPYSGDGEWGMSHCGTSSGRCSSASTGSTDASSSLSGGSPVPPAPSLQRSLTIDFSKPIFGDDDVWEGSLPFTFLYGSAPAY
jgi:hypothetical protein